jgi:hypothetical protein
MLIPNKSLDVLDAEARRFHRWFAWYPVRIGHYHLAWLEPVLRRAATVHPSDSTLFPFTTAFRYTWDYILCGK